MHIPQSSIMLLLKAIVNDAIVMKSWLKVPIQENGIFMENETCAVRRRWLDFVVKSNTLDNE